MRYGVSFFAVASIALLAGAAAAEERWAIATSSTGSGPFIVGSSIAEIVNPRTDLLAISAQTSGGYNENLSLVASGQVQLALTSLSDLGAAWRGDGQFEALPNAQQLFEPLRRLFPVTTANMHCVARADSGFASFEDLRGARLNINVPATTTQTVNRAMLDALGMSVDDFQIFEIATSGSFDALRDGIVDATCNYQPLPSGATLQLSSSVPVTLFPLHDEAFEKLNEQYRGSMIRIEIPAGTYRGQDEAVPSFGFAEVLFTHKDVSEDLIYEFTRAYWEGSQPDHPAFSLITIENAAIDVDPPMHPGAERFFREMGIID